MIVLFVSVIGIFFMYMCGVDIVVVCCVLMCDVMCGVM